MPKSKVVETSIPWIEIKDDPIPDAETLQRWADREAKMNVICRACPGYCCDVFSLPYTLEEYAERLEELQLSAGGNPTEQQAEDIEGLKTALAWFVPLNGSVRSKRLKGVRSTIGSILWPAEHFHTCRMYDPAVGICKAHDDRPFVCRRFRCDEVLLFKMPRRKAMLSGNRVSTSVRYSAARLIGLLRFWTGKYMRRKLFRWIVRQVVGVDNARDILAAKQRAHRRRVAGRLPGSHP